ncbi:VWA domain-containing protein, partial [Desulfosarcina sp.]|nr:VWA domain-containing protein [Desulfosarcina sp.]
MQKHTIHICLMVIFAIGIFMLSGTRQLLAASFTAEMVEIHKGKAKTNKIYRLDHQYRLDVEEDGSALNILVDRKSGKTRLIVPLKKVYLEIDNNDMQSLSNNPFEAYQYMVKNYESRSAGEETLNGLACDKLILSAQGQDVMTAWIASKYSFAIKLENSMDGRTMTLENLRDGGVEASMFEVPPEYKLVKSMPIEPPDWASEIPAAPIMKPPFEKSLQEGQIIRIKPLRDFNVDLKVKSLSGTSGSFSSNTFKDGRPLKMVTGYAGGGRIVHKESPEEADEIVVRAKSGQITVEAELVDAHEDMVLITLDFKANSGRQFSIDHRKAAHLIISDHKSDGKSSRGTLVIFTTITKDMDGGGTIYENKEVERHELFMANGESKTYHFEQDQKIGSIDITIMEGSVQARVEQPEKPGIIPPAWTKKRDAVSVAVTSQKSTAPKKTFKATNPAAKDPAMKGTETARMVLVLDGSGSMWGQIDGKAKIEIAKEVTAELIDQIPADFQTGLTVYGHRRKGDCKDIEMVIPVRPHDGAAMKAKVQGISPKGKTPLSESVKQAAQALRYTEERATVILVSDGLETCDIDPCALAAELAMSGVDFTVHVIGFDISKEDQGRLRCLADKTGGLFLAASDAGSLRDALFQTVEEVKAPPPPVVEDPGTAVLKGPASVPAGAAFSVQWEGPDSRNDYIAISKKGTKDLSHKDYTYAKKGNPADFTAPGEVGDYELRYIHSHSQKVIGRTDIKVTPVQATVQAPAEADVAVKFEVNWQGPNYSSDYVALARPDQRAGSQIAYTYTQRGNPLKLQAPSDPGTYEVRYILGRNNQLLAKTTIKIKGVGAS